MVLLALEKVQICYDVCLMFSEIYLQKYPEYCEGGMVNCDNEEKLKVLLHHQKKVSMSIGSKHNF